MCGTNRIVHNNERIFNTETIQQRTNEKIIHREIVFIGMVICRLSVVDLPVGKHQIFSNDQSKVSSLIKPR